MKTFPANDILYKLLALLTLIVQKKFRCLEANRFLLQRHHCQVLREKPLKGGHLIDISYEHFSELLFQTFVDSLSILSDSNQ